MDLEEEEELRRFAVIADLERLTNAER